MNFKTPQPFNFLRNIYLKTQQSQLQCSFLKACINDNIIPKGFRVSFNLASCINDVNLVNKIQSILSECSSRLLDEVIISKEQGLSANLDELSHCEKNILEISGRFEGLKILENVKKEAKETLQNNKKRHKKKLDFWKSEKSALSQFSRCLGSRRITGSLYVRKNVSSFISTQTRPHRAKRTRAKRKNEYKKRVRSNDGPSEDDIERLNPVVLAKNVELSETDKSVLRLSDKFAPAPRTHLDVSDMTLGTFRWAESIRWTEFWYIWKEGKQRDRRGYDDLGDDDLKEFEKTPWYKRSDRHAPYAGPETENYIAECQAQFLEPANRRRIKGNFTKEQWESVQKLKNLPMTHNSACRFADKSSKTIITDLDNDDSLVMADLNDSNYYDCVNNDPTERIKAQIKRWTATWKEKGVIDDDQAAFISNISETEPGKIKPLIKTHKPQPWPIRVLLSGSNTPVQPLSKFVQFNIKHLPSHLPHQILDTKAFLLKIEKINQLLSPLPQSTVITICDVVKLYPSVNNDMGVPAVKRMLDMFPSPYIPLTDCIIEALQICLSCNICKFTTGDGKNHLRMPNRGTAMGPCHACDYVDVFMGQLDKQTVDESPVPLLSTLLPTEIQKDNLDINWSRFRDDGITFLADPSHVETFSTHLQRLHPDIKWEVESGSKMNYLNLTVKIINGRIETDEYSKSSHNYLHPGSCHPPSTFKGLITSKGTQLRMNCSTNKDLGLRIEEYSGYFGACGWSRDKARRELTNGANYSAKDTEEESKAKRRKLLFRPRNKRPKKIAWVSTWDPRAPDKSKIIHNNMHLLYRNPKNKLIFPKGLIIAANRRRPNLSELIKPTIPRRFVQHGPFLEQGSFPCKGASIPPRCNGACDLCKHVQVTKDVTSPWDGRKWKIMANVTCQSPNIIYLIICNCSNHSDYAWYVGSTTDMQDRWRNHRSDFLLKKRKKCGFAQHSEEPHPVVQKTTPLPFISTPIWERHFGAELKQNL